MARRGTERSASTSSARFVHLEAKEEEDAKGHKIKKEAMIFPRFHQWDVVTRIERAVRQDGAGPNYLAQHSAGSGKSTRSPGELTVCTVCTMPRTRRYSIRWWP